MILTKEQEEFLHEMYVESNDFENLVNLMEEDFGLLLANDNQNLNVEH